VKLAAEGNPLEVGDLEMDWTFEAHMQLQRRHAYDFQALIQTTITVASLYETGVSMFASGPSTTAARQCMRSFSTTRLCRSKIGSAPLSLPQEVKFSILPPAVVKTGRGVSRDGQGSTVEISGPLGTMKMNIPAYMSIEENDENRTRTLRILDAEDRKQREMWGEWFGT
jgi:large subunit ribosomal protein L6